MAEQNEQTQADEDIMPFCENCFYFHSDGQCRRHAPTAIIMAVTEPERDYYLIWPSVDLYDWCGEWKSNAARESE